MTNTDTQIAQTIATQIGRSALFMIGARNLVASENALTLKLGRNEKSVTHLRFTLDPTDTYTVEAIRVGRAPNFKITDLENVSGVYFDQLRTAIESLTGLATSL